LISFNLITITLFDNNTDAFEYIWNYFLVLDYSVGKYLSFYLTKIQRLQNKAIRIIFYCSI